MFSLGVGPGSNYSFGALAARVNCECTVMIVLLNICCSLQHNYVANWSLRVVLGN